MGYYSVLVPCVVGRLHYATVPAQPITVDDEIAADLVASGVLAPYRPGQEAAIETAVDTDTDTEGGPETPARTRRRRPHEG